LVERPRGLETRNVNLRRSTGKAETRIGGSRKNMARLSDLKGDV
jgi:hypothetical protein